MPTTPVYGGQKVNEGGMPGVRANTNASAADYGGGVAQGVAQLGGAVSDLGVAMGQVKTREAYMEAERKHTEYGVRLGAYADELRVTHPGTKANAASVLFAEKKAALRSELAPTDPTALRVFDASVMNSDIRTGSEMSVWAERESYQVDQATLLSGAGLDTDNATSFYIHGDTVRGDAAALSADTKIATAGSEAGEPAELIQSKIQKNRQALNSDVVTTFIENKQYIEASAFLKARPDSETRKEFDPKQRALLESSISERAAMDVGFGAADSAVTAQIGLNPFNPDLAEIQAGGSALKGKEKEYFDHQVEVRLKQHAANRTALLNEQKSTLAATISGLRSVKGASVDQSKAILNYKTDPRTAPAWFALSQSERDSLTDYAMNGVQADDNIAARDNAMTMAKTGVMPPADIMVKLSKKTQDEVRGSVNQYSKDGGESAAWSKRVLDQAAKNKTNANDKAKMQSLYAYIDGLHRSTPEMTEVQAHAYALAAFDAMGDTPPQAINFKNEDEANNLAKAANDGGTETMRSFQLSLSQSPGIWPQGIQHNTLNTPTPAVDRIAVSLLGTDTASWRKLQQAAMTAPNMPAPRTPQERDLRAIEMGIMAREASEKWNLANVPSLPKPNAVVSKELEGQGYMELAKTIGQVPSRVGDWLAKQWPDDANR